MASQKTTQLQRYMSRGGVGTGSAGDLRITKLQTEDNSHVCPPLGYVEQSLKILEEAKVAPTVVGSHGIYGYRNRPYTWRCWSGLLSQQCDGPFQRRRKSCFHWRRVGSL